MINLSPIGFVHNSVKENPARDFKWENVISEIWLKEEYVPALEGLEGFSHLLIIYYIDKQPRPVSLKVHPRGGQSLPQVGLFASRSPSRPNPLGLKLVSFIKREENILRVQGLDALNGTAVLDIKPYLPGYDSVHGAKVPPWSY